MTKGEPRGPVRVRFAPSPTGSFHVGGARTALFNWLFARREGGKFILRIEDTDKERSKPEFEREILESLKWLGLNWDEGPLPAEGGNNQIPNTKYQGDYGPYRQSERGDIYREYLEKLLKSGQAYYCYCTPEELEAQRMAMVTQGLAPKYSGHCRNLTSPPPGKTAQLIRFKTPEARVEFKDIIRGNVSFDAGLLGDMPLAKSLDAPLYNFAVVIDDELMQITHVLRGEDHISNTPKQILLARALGFKEPLFGHLPLILSADRSKLSKRYAETALLAYREQGYLPEAMVNFLALLGWHPTGDEEVMTLGEITQAFDLRRVQKGGAIWNEEKLRWLNGEHIRRVPTANLVQLLAPRIQERGIKASPDLIARASGAVQERMKTLSDFFELADFFFELPDYEASLLRWQNDSAEQTKAILSEVRAKLAALSSEFPDKEVLIEALDDLTVKYGKGSVLWPLRVALSGKSASPDPYAIMYVLGRSEALHRIDTACAKLD